MDIAWYIYPVLLLAGLAAGITNTLAGSGSVFTLSSLILLGIPSNIANCTNRVGVLFQNVMGIYTFHRNGKFQLDNSKKRFTIATLAGAMVGAIAAVEMPAEILDMVVGTVMIFLLVIVVVDPKKQLGKKGDKLMEGNLFRDSLIFFAIGFYGGFIQIGIGIFLLVGLSLFSEMNLIASNAYKLFIVLLYTIPTLGYMIYQDQIIWLPGLILAVGQVAGAYLAGTFASKSPNAAIWIKRLLMLMISLTIIKTFFF